MEFINRLVYWVSILLIVALILFAVLFVKCALMADLPLSVMFLSGAVIFASAAALLAGVGMICRSRRVPGRGKGNGADRLL